MTSAVYRLGNPAAILTAVFAIIYSVFQLVAAFSIIKHPYELTWLFIPSIFLAFCYVITIVCLHYTIPVNRKVYTAIASLFAAVYCTLVSLVYFTQLTVFVPALMNGVIDDTNTFAFTGKSFMVSADALGYTVLDLSALFIAFAFYKIDKKLFTWFFLNGLLAPVVVLAFYSEIFLYLGALWMITFPVAMLLAAKHLKDQGLQMRS